MDIRDNNTLSGLLFRRSWEKQATKDKLFKLILRPYQQEIQDKINSFKGILVYICVARRGGKDQTIFDYAAKKCHENKNYRVLYIFPTAKQGKMNLLDGVTGTGESFLRSILNPAILQLPRSGALYFHDNIVRFRNGSNITFVGDDGDSLVGGNQNLVVVSEAAQVKDETIQYLIPSVKLVNGKIICISTPRYGSKFNEILLNPNNDEEVLKLIYPAPMLCDNGGNRVYPDDELDKLKSIMTRAKFASEYMCDLTCYEETSIYGNTFSMATMYNEQQMPDLRYCSIFISADLGISDNSSFTFAVNYNNKLIIFDQYRNRNVPTQHYIDYFNKWCLDRQINKKQVTIILPHDGRNTLDVGKYLTSRQGFYEQAGFKTIVLNPISVLMGIEIARTAIETGDMVFLNTPNVIRMMDIIRAYEWKVSSNGDIIYVPKHGSGFAASNDADSMEYMAMAFLFEKYSQEVRTEGGVIIKPKGVY